MAQYRARAKAGWEASATVRAEHGADKMTGSGGTGPGDGHQSSENKQALAAKEEENEVHMFIENPRPTHTKYPNGFGFRNLASHLLLLMVSTGSSSNLMRPESNSSRVGAIFYAYVQG